MVCASEIQRSTDIDIVTWIEGQLAIINVSVGQKALYEKVIRLEDLLEMQYLQEPVSCSSKS